MRHRKAHRKLSKPTDQRKALLRCLAEALLKNEKIVTSRPRALETRAVAEKLIALAKKGGLSSRRKALSILPNKSLIKHVFTTAPDRFKANPGGVTRITGVAIRRGDAADMVSLELI